MVLWELLFTVVSPRGKRKEVFRMFSPFFFRTELLSLFTLGTKQGSQEKLDPGSPVDRIINCCTT